MPTKIEWSMNQDGTPGEVWNFLEGCTHASEGCAHCFAERLFNRRHPDLSFNVVNVHTDRLAKPLRTRRPRTFFVNSMSDFFHVKVSVELIRAAFTIMAATPQHTYIILTKRHKRMVAVMNDMAGYWDSNKIFGRAANIRDSVPEETYNLLQKPDKIMNVYNAEWPLGNVWLLVSTENQHWFDERTAFLKDTKAVVRGVSIEPQIGPITLGDAVMWLDWVLLGFESGPGSRRGDVSWFRNIIGECKDAGVPVFVKQFGTVLGKEMGMSDYKGGDFDLFPTDLQVREMPREFYRLVFRRPNG